MSNTIWAQPRNIGNIDECDFYHTMDIPDHGTVQGLWDLRGREADYLGNIDLQGKRVLEIGTASGHLCFTMEEMGAEVVAYDLSENQQWDIVPYAAYDYQKIMTERKAHIRRLNNGYWFAHKRFNSKAKVSYGTVYEVPDDIGQFDCCTFGSILLHLRDPFLALQRITAHVTDKVIVSEVVPKVAGKLWFATEFLADFRLARFLPKAKKQRPFETWWHLSPKLIEEFVQILGFEDTRITYHQQKYLGKESKLYTVVGTRTKPAAAL